MISQTDALDEIAADLDSEDDFDGEWCDEDGDLCQKWEVVLRPRSSWAGSQQWLELIAVTRQYA